MARASGLEWSAVHCEVEGKLERVDRITRFTHFDIVAPLQITDPDHRDKAERCLEKAEQSCLITHSLTSETTLRCEIGLVEVE